MTKWRSTPYGQYNGKIVHLYELRNNNGITVEIINFGGAVVSIKVPDRQGVFEDVVLGFSSMDDYVQNPPFFGAIIGRHANRIEGAQFSLNGRDYHLAKNNGNNHLHGGNIGFDKVVWDATPYRSEHGNAALRLTYTSTDGEEGYPGNLDIQVTYTLTQDNELVMEYAATTDQDTVVNLTNHSYFNLTGHASGDMLHHHLQINATHFTPINNECIPTGEIRKVDGSPMDFRNLTPIGPGLQSHDEQVLCGQGYDHNWVLQVNGQQPEKAAELYDPRTGRMMEMFTTKPGVQFYSGNFLTSNLKGKDGVTYDKWGGLCLETQYFPNALKHQHFPSPILKAGEIYKHTTSYKFSVR
jgi:aldose 1-epimerase